MMDSSGLSKSKISRIAIHKLYVNMKHLFFRGHYKPMGMSGEGMINAMMSLKPEIYGAIDDPEKVELDGLLYIFQRLPIGIEECRYINLISREGLEKSKFEPIIPSKRRRNCYRIDEEQMYIEITRGRSDIYDILTHLTFMFIESEKIKRNALNGLKKNRAWQMLEKKVLKLESGDTIGEEVGITYLGVLLGRTFDETLDAVKKFDTSYQVNSLFHICYWLGKLSIDEQLNRKNREINFSSTLRDRLGSHEFGEVWANTIKGFIAGKNWIDRPIHIISANLHSVMNSLFGKEVMQKETYTTLEDLAEKLSLFENREMRDAISIYALKNGMYQFDDDSGTNISVQIFDFDRIPERSIAPEIHWKKEEEGKNPVVIVMDYAFGEQAFETMDELLKPFDKKGSKRPLNIQSINIMGKAGILKGDKGDIMIPTAHVFEGSTDNYPFENALNVEDFQNAGLGVYYGPMITVLGTSLQNKNLLEYFQDSWGMIGLEMEGVHYQKAIQIASKIRKSIPENVVVRYAYYASDNPIMTGGTLASGSLGLDGVKPTYLITTNILNGILNT